MVALSNFGVTVVLFCLTEEFLVEDINNYRFLTCGNVPVAGVDDAAEFRLTIEAMNIMGISAEEQSGKVDNGVKKQFSKNYNCMYMHLHVIPSSVMNFDF